MWLGGIIHFKNCCKTVLVMNLYCHLFFQHFRVSGFIWWIFLSTRNNTISPSLLSIIIASVKKIGNSDREYFFAFAEFNRGSWIHKVKWKNAHNLFENTILLDSCQNIFLLTRGQVTRFRMERDRNVILNCLD
jgi:hypothetical protein